MKQLFLLDAALVMLLAAAPACAATAIKACGGTIRASGSYVVTKNLTVKSGGGDCITVTASNVTIDLSGYNINCNSVTGANGIFTAAATTGLTFRNGIIARCADGINASASTGVLIDEVLTLSNSLEGIHLGQNSTMMHSISNFNGNDGILVECPSNVIYNTAIGNGIFGIGYNPHGTACNFQDNATQ